MNRKTKSANAVVLIIIILFFATGCLFSIVNKNSTIVKAYTEEQKQQAKAWLSAHGYSPTKEGAYQAYEDYLNGKLILNESEQKRVNKELAKSSKKSATKKKKAGKKKKVKNTTKNKVTPTAELTAVPSAKLTATPTALPTSTVTATSHTREVNKYGVEEKQGHRKGYLYLAEGICFGLLLAVIVLICKKKSSAHKK